MPWEAWAKKSKKKLDEHHRTHRYDGDPWWRWTKAGASNHRQRVSARERATAVRQKDLLRILEDQGYRCALTGWPLTPGNAHLDHIQPLSRGGLHVADNIQILRDVVNLAKGKLSQAEFVELCQAVASLVDANDREAG